MTTQSSAYRKYLVKPDHSCHVTIEEAEALGRDLASAVQLAGLSPHLVVGLANGAFFPAKIVAESLALPWHMVKVRRRGSRLKQRLLFVKQCLHIPSALIMWAPIKALWVIFQNRTNTLESNVSSFAFDVAGKSVLLVDDCVETGASFRYVSDRLRASGAAEIHTAVYCWSRMPNVDDAVSRPDLHLHRQIQYYPWSNNSHYLKNFHLWLESNDLALWK